MDGDSEDVTLDVQTGYVDLGVGGPVDLDDLTDQDAWHAGVRWVSEVDHSLRRVEVHPLFDSEGHVLWEDGCPCQPELEVVDVSVAQGVNAPGYRMWTHNAFDGRE